MAQYIHASAPGLLSHLAVLHQAITRVITYTLRFSHGEKEVGQENRYNRQALDHCAQGMEMCEEWSALDDLSAALKRSRKEALCGGKSW